MLSRPRSLAKLTSIGLTDKVRAIIEQGPPEELVANFRKLFDAKIEETKSFAIEAAKRYGPSRSAHRTDDDHADETSDPWP